MHHLRTILLSVVAPIAVAIVLALVARTVLFQVYAVPSESMLPTLDPGDHILATPYRAPWPQRAPHPGDVVVFRMPGDPERTLVKRVVAEAGDLVECRGGRLIVRGHAAAEPYLAPASATCCIAPQVIPGGCVFVLGDNRADSLDSRSWGPLPSTAVLGRVRLVLWRGREDAGRSGAPTRSLAGWRLFHVVR